MSLANKRKLCWIFALLCCLMLTACAERVAFSQGKVSSKAQSVALVLQPGEAQLLDGLSQLQSADFSGSVCYDEILAWWQAHPQVDVYYTVAFPDGTVADNKSESLDLPAPKSGECEQIAALLEYLPALKSLSFEQGKAVLSPDDFAAIIAARPDLQLDCRISLPGRTVASSLRSFDLTGASSSDAEIFASVLPGLYKLTSLELGSDISSPELSWDDIAAFQALRPELHYEYNFSLYGKDFSINDSQIDINHIRVDDKGLAVSQAMACMPNLTFLDMDSCKVSDEDMAAIRDAYPHVEVVWRIWFGGNYSVRTNVEKILASQPSRGGMLTSENAQCLKYCTKLKYLDVGHNAFLQDISFVSYMPDLEVFIGSISGWGDASPLADCPKLEYLEIQTTQVCDLSPLSGLTQLRHLNICYLYELEDISPLYGLSQLERLWIGCLTPIPEEQIEIMQENAPNCVINTTTYDPTEGGWRFIGTNRLTGAPIRDPRYDLLVDQFGYDKADYAFAWRDPLY